MLRARLTVIDRELAKLADQVARPELFVEPEQEQGGSAMLSIRY